MLPVRNVRLLILEDDPAHAEALRRAFVDADWTAVEIVTTLAEFRARCAARDPDFALADLVLPDGQATELLHAPAEQQAYPIVIMTSHGDERTVVAVLKAGAFDYVVKSSESFAEMPHTIERVQREWALIQERKHAAAEREQLQRQLAQAQKMETIGRLTGGIAHDFNNILASILGFTDLALTRHVPDSQSKLHEYLAHVKRAAERARDLVASMLAVTRVNKSEASTVDVADTVREVTQLLRPIIPSSIQLNSHVAPTTIKLWLDATRLHQALMNLCLNARDAVDEHGVIDIAIEVNDSLTGECASCHASVQGHWLALSVSDNGSGMPAEVMEKMFDAFYTTKAMGRGTGLGLATVHNIAHEAGGHILVKSEPGKGTTITLLLPPGGESLGERAGENVAHTLPTGRGQRVMIVDDDAAVAQLVNETLLAYGYNPTVFTDSKAAWEYFAADPHRVDAVITDYTMPGLTGGDLANAMLARRPGLPILICTGYTDKLNADSRRQLGIAHYLEKPVAIDRLLHSLAEVLPATKRDAK